MKIVKVALIIWALCSGATFLLFAVAAWTTRHNPVEPEEYEEYE